MRFWRFLKYELPHLFLAALVFLIVSVVFLSDSQVGWQWETLLYSLLLVGCLMISFTIHRYFKNIHVIKHMRDEEVDNLSLEAFAYRQALEQMEREHIRALNAVQSKQNEYYDFIVSWFHEVKTPIAVLRLMQQTEIDSRSLEEQVSRIEHYVDQALYYAKLDSFNQDYEIVNCDLELLIKEVIKQHSKTFIGKKIKLSLALHTAMVQSDSKWLQFIMNQLITNSLKYTADQGEISISTAVDPKERQLIIKDNGIGIETQDIQRIFKRGFTGTNGRTYMHSTGMGLYLAQELSNKLGHYITCKSEPGQFTEMVIHFPRNNDPFLMIL